MGKEPSGARGGARQEDWDAQNDTQDSHTTGAGEDGRSTAA